MINYNNPTDNEIRRIMAEALRPNKQAKILAELTGRSVDDILAVCDIAPKKRKRNGNNFTWNEEAVNYIREHPNEKCQLIAQILGISASAVQSKRYQLGIKQQTIWTEDMVDKVVTAYRCGFKAKKIAEMMDLDLYAVQKKITTLRQQNKL